MNDPSIGWMVSCVGFVLSSVGGLGVELLDRFAGRSLEAYCRLKKNRERFGALLDHQDAAIQGSDYLRLIGTVVFLVAGTVAVLARGGEFPEGLANEPAFASEAAIASEAEFASPSLQLFTWIIAACGLLLLTHVWIPSAVTRFASTPVLYHTWPFWRGLSIAMRPLAAPGELVEIMTRRLTGTQESEDEDEEQLEDEIRTIVTAGTREGYFGPGVREMIQGVMTLHEDTVGHIMTPLGDVDAIDVTADWHDVLATVAESGRTRLPVYNKTLDDIVGVLYVKDLLPYLVANRMPDKPLSKIARRPWTVPKDRSVELLLREFLHSRSHMAIVVDEFQQTAGVVTIEDALEEIVGEIVDESDEHEEFGIQIVDDSTAEVDGRVPIDDLNEALNWDLPESEDYETVAGYVLFHTGLIPDEGQRLTIGDTQFEILKASNRKIESIRIQRVPILDQSVSS